MKRIQLFEFEDLNWFPSSFRGYLTNLIIVFHKVMGTKEVIVNLISEIKKTHSFSTIVDIGSGSGGVMPAVITTYNSQNKEDQAELILTDLYPNKTIGNRINNANQEKVSYLMSSLNATQMDQAPQGLKTMICSFHHMPKSVAKNILRSAQANLQPLLIYEIAENKLPILVWIALLPISLIFVSIMTLILTVFVQPLRINQLIFTYCIPIIPLCWSWDAQASLVRIYTFEDIQELIGQFNQNNYEWTIKQATKENGKKLGYYILGLPKKPC